MLVPVVARSCDCYGAEEATKPHDTDADLAVVVMLTTQGATGSPSRRRIGNAWAKLKNASPNEVRVAVEREKCRRSLSYFTQSAWHVVEPTRKFKPNWHLDAITEHLEAVTKGHISALLLLVPPGMMKSLNVSVFWPAWEWGPYGRPDRRFLFASYAQHLSLRDSRKCRRVIRSNWYQACWGADFWMEPDQDTAHNFQNNHSGFRLATSTEGVSTGERADRVGFDDAHKVTEVESDLERQSTILWWDEAMSTRVNDPEDCAFVGVMQRLHQYDLAGHIIEQGGYTVLELPMEYEPKRMSFTSVRPKNYTGPDKKKYRWDPRRKEGELLFPDLVGPKALKRLKRRLGVYGSAAQLQLRPSVRGGGLVRLDWFRRFGVEPDRRKIKRVIQSWDTAETGEGTGRRKQRQGQSAAYSVCGTWAETKEGYLLLHVMRRRLNIPDLERAVTSQALMAKSRWKPPAVILVENKSSGKAIIQYCQRNDKFRWPVLPIEPDKDKVVRMDVETPAIEAGKVWLPESASWLSDYEEELINFPASKYKDQVDMTSQFLRWMREKGDVGDDWGMY